MSVTCNKAVQPRESAEKSTRQVRDEQIELAETDEEFRRIVLETPDGEEIEYLTTLAYDPINVISIYSLRTVIEILCRELKQYFNIEKFYSKSLNGVLLEVFCALTAYVLVMWFRQCHPVKGGMAVQSSKLKPSGTRRWIRPADHRSITGDSRHPAATAVA